MAASERAAWKRTSNRGIVEGQHQAIGGPLRHAHGEYARQPASNGVVLIRIEQRVGELPNPLFGDLAQREQGVVRNGVPGEQRDHVRDERPGHARLPGEDIEHPVTLARSQRQNVAELGVD